MKNLKFSFFTSHYAPRLKKNMQIMNENNTQTRIKYGDYLNSCKMFF